MPLIYYKVYDLKLTTNFAWMQDKVKVINKVILQFFSSNKNISPPLTECLHILDAYRKILLNGFTSSEAHGGDIITIAQHQ